MKGYGVIIIHVWFGTTLFSFFPLLFLEWEKKYSKNLTYVQNSLTCRAETWLTLAPRSKRRIARDGGTSNIKITPIGLIVEFMNLVC